MGLGSPRRILAEAARDAGRLIAPGQWRSAVLAESGFDREGITMVAVLGTTQRREKLHAVGLSVMRPIQRDEDFAALVGETNNRHFHMRRSRAAASHG